MELIRILAAHARRYPLMCPADAVKLIYQNEFGCGHLVTDEADCLLRLRAELAAIPPGPDRPLLEDVGNGLFRVSLTAADAAGYTPEELNRDFVRSAALHTGSRASFLNKLETLKDLTRLGFFSFSLDEADGFLAACLASGCPPVSHSPRFRAAYAPAYRLVDRRCLSLPAPPAVPRLTPNELASLLSEKLAPSGRAPLLVAIDGRCAAGKTTLASLLRRRCGCAVVSMDDFFLRPEQRTPRRLARPGGNVDYARFLSQVLLPLYEGRPAVYRPFDCHTGRFASPVRVPPSPVTVVEGSYSCHPALRSYYGLRVFLTVAPEEQTRRLLAREGPEGLRMFRTRWVPLEERYISACEPDRQCDFCFETA